MSKAVVKVALKDHGGSHENATLALVDAFARALYGKPIAECFGQRSQPVLGAGDEIVIHIPYWYCGSTVRFYGRRHLANVELEDMTRHARARGVQVRYA